jgi:tetratricopeptide (TPR) repeat protein
VRRRTPWILVSCLAALAALVAVVAIAATAAVPPNLSKTLETQRRLAAERPQDASVFNDLGNLLLLVPEPAEAEAAYRKAIELDPDRTTALFNLGLLLQQRGELREAMKHYRRVVEREPRHAWAHYQIGTIQEKWGQASRAVDSYAQAFALDPQLAFPEVNPHVVENKLLTESMMRAYKNDFNQPQAPRLYEDPGRIATMLVPPAANQAEQDQMADKAQKPAAQQQGQAAGRQPGAAGRPAGQPAQGQPAQGQPGSTVLRERDLDRGNPAGQALPQGAARGGQYGQPPRGLREWSRPDPTIQEIPNGPVDTDDEGVQPAPVITPPPGGVYYRPGVQSTGRMSLRIVPERPRSGRG